MPRLCLLLVIAMGPACGSDAPRQTCTPGASVACVGVGGCMGGQMCNAQGTGFGACQCAVDAAAADAMVDGAPTPTEGGVHLTWTLRGAVSNNVLTCAQASAQTIDLALTPSGGSNVIDNLFTCTAMTGDALQIPFGNYNFSVQALNSSMQGLGPAVAGQVTLAASPCDRIISGDCMKDENATILIDGM